MRKLPKFDGASSLWIVAIFISFCFPFCLVNSQDSQIDSPPENSAEARSSRLPVSPGLIGGVISAILVAAISAAAKSGSASLIDGRYRINFGIGGKIFGVVMVLISAAIVGVAVMSYLHGGDIPIGAVVGLFAFFVVVLLFVMKVLTQRIEYDESAVYEFSWIGKRRIFWDDFNSDALYSKAFTLWKIGTKSGKALKISEYMAGRDDFLEEFSRKTQHSVEWN